MIGFYNYTVILTYLGVLSAIVGIFSAFDGHVSTAVVCLMLSGFCDMFDGTVARTRERTVPEKQFGIQIDSLADLICFGVLPASIGYAVGLRNNLGLLILSCYVLAALIRLAYFNVMEEERQKLTPGEKRTFYEGLPVTNAALIFPIVSGFRRVAGENFFKFYAIALVVTSLLFLLRIKVKKAGFRAMVCLAGIGIFLLIWIIRGYR